MSAVLVHTPAGFARTLRANDWPLLTATGYRVWQALLNRFCDPNCRSVAARFRINKDTAARALNSLIECGLLRRARRSAGRRIFAWCYLITDEPFAWLGDKALDTKFTRAHDEEVERLRSWLDDRDEALDTLPPVPEPDAADAGSPQLASCPATSDVPNKDSCKEFFPPTPLPVDHSVHRPSRFELRMLDLHRRHPELQPHIPQALALLHGLGLPPLSRVRHARVVALGLHTGLRLDELIAFLTSEMSTARNRRAVIGHRLKRLTAELDRRFPQYSKV